MGGIFCKMPRARSLIPTKTDSQLRSRGASNRPLVPPSELRKVLPVYPRPILAAYLQLPQLDPRIEKLARDVTAPSQNEFDKAIELSRTA